MKVVIVGNGASLLSRSNGDFIDSCDRVIRMGACIVDGYEKYVGSKRDIYGAFWKKIEMLYHNLNWYGSPSEKVTTFADISKYRNYWWAAYDPRKYTVSEMKYNPWVSSEGYDHFNAHDSIIEKLNLNKVNHTYFEKNSFESLCQSLSAEPESNIIPTTGMVFIEMALNLYQDNSEIYITGFDQFNSGWYWNPQRVHIPFNHWVLKERLLINSYIRKGKLISLDDKDCG